MKMETVTHLDGTSSSRVAVVIPCRNEAATIASVIRAIKKELPDARVVVVDNASTDNTRSQALAAGAHVENESRVGKGFALLRGFECVVDAELVVMIDGDGTYSTPHVGALLEAAGAADMVVGARLADAHAGSFSVSHSIGNRLFVLLVRVLFGMRTTDLLSGYRVLSRRFLDALPLLANGFEVETEMALHALTHNFSVVEIATPYAPRVSGSTSKLRTYRDGYRILLTVLAYFRDYRPLTCFSVMGGILLALGLWAGSYPIGEYLETGFVYRLPLAVLAVGLVLLSAICAIAGLLLSSMNRRAMEVVAHVVRRGRRH